MENPEKGGLGQSASLRGGLGQFAGLRGGLGQFAGLRGGLAKKRGGGVFEGVWGWYPNAHYGWSPVNIVWGIAQLYEWKVETNLCFCENFYENIDWMSWKA